MYSIREAKPSDAKLLSKVAEETFRATFAVANTPGNMDAHCRDCYGESLQLAEILNPALVTLLGEHEDQLVGFAQIRWGSPPECVSGEKPGEVQPRIIAIELNRQDDVSWCDGPPYAMAETVFDEHDLIGCRLDSAET